MLRDLPFIAAGLKLVRLDASQVLGLQRCLIGHWTLICEGWTGRGDRKSWRESVFIALLGNHLSRVW
jgi:hypothetical protein